MAGWRWGAVRVGSSFPRVGNGRKGRGVARGCPRLESRDGLVGAHRGRWGSSRASAGLEVRKDAVDDLGFGDHGEELHFRAAIEANQWVDLEDLSEQTGPGSAARRGGGGSGVGLWLRR